MITLFKRLTCFSIAYFATVGGTSTALAQVTSVTMNGNGCADGAASATVSPDGKVVSIIFDQYILQTVSGGPATNMQCGVRMTVNVPKGKRILASRVDYRYFADLPKASRLMFFTSIMHVHPGTVFDIIPRNDLRNDRYGPMSGNQQQGHMVSHPALINPKIKCGSPYDLLASSIVDLSDQGMEPGAEALVTVDSLDSGFVQYTFSESKCK